MDISIGQQQELSVLLTEILETVKQMRKVDRSYLLRRQEQDAEDWLNFLNTHRDYEELQSLYEAIVKAFTFEYPGFSECHQNQELDSRRLLLIKAVMDKFYEFIHK
ncbi:MAG: hypothetical protein J6M05_05960 [Cardiobacteriaceae bacterium]|nr:hypothetical protein [Cardiobacteriaceae bacterium]